MLSTPFISETVLTLAPEEIKLVDTSTNNTDKNRLIFAVMLKFFQARGRYPTKKDPIEPVLLYSLAKQLDAQGTLFEPPYLETRTAKRFRC